MTSTLTIRSIRDEDLIPVIDLWRACNLTRPWNDPNQDIAFAREHENSDILLGYLNNQLVASAMVGHDGHRGAAYYVAVHPDFHGRGLGAQIMGAAENWLKEKGVWKINLLVRKENTEVIRFYEQQGYTDGETVQLGKRLDGQ